MVDHHKDPTAGSFSYHEGFLFAATQDIQAGEELFVNYGESWMETRSGTYVDLIPRKSDYVAAGKIMHRLIEPIAEQIGDTSAEGKSSLSHVIDMPGMTFYDSY